LEKILVKWQREKERKEGYRKRKWKERSRRKKKTKRSYKTTGNGRRRQKETGEGRKEREKAKRKKKEGKRKKTKREEYQEMRISEGDNLPLSSERAIVNSDVDKEKKEIIIQLRQSKFDGEKKEHLLFSARRECLSSYEDSADVLNESISTGHYIL